MTMVNPIFGSKEYFSKLYAMSEEPWGISFRASQQCRYDVYIQMLRQFSHRYDSVLDIGCSQGQFTMLLKDIASKITAIDISETSIQRAKTKYGDCKKMNFEVGSLPLLKYKDNQFDLVLVLEVLCYLGKKDRIRALKETKRILTKDGFLLMSVNINKPPYFQIDEFYNLIKSFFQIKKVNYAYGKIYFFFEKRLLILNETIFKNTIRHFLSIKVLVGISEFLTKLILAKKGITNIYILAEKTEN